MSSPFKEGLEWDRANKAFWALANLLDGPSGMEIVKVTNEIKDDPEKLILRACEFLVMKGLKIESTPATFGSHIQKLWESRHGDRPAE